MTIVLATLLLVVSVVAGGFVILMAIGGLLYTTAARGSLLRVGFEEWATGFTFIFLGASGITGSALYLGSLL